MKLNLNKEYSQVKIALIISLINLITLSCFGTYFEGYESIFSSFIQGIYTNQSYLDWNTNIHFLLFPVYTYLSTLFPDIQTYGMILTIYNFTTLTAMGLVLFKIMYHNLKIINTPLILSIYLILSVDNIINLSTTRIVFMATATILCYIESCHHLLSRISIYKWFVLCGLLSFLCLLRTEAVLLFSVAYIIINTIFKQIRKTTFLPLLISLLYFLIFNLAINIYSSEAKQLYFYKEKDIIDRCNIDIKNMSNNNLMEITAFKKYGIIDKDLFRWDFNNSISITKNKKKGIVNLVDGIKPHLFINTIKNSESDLWLSSSYIVFYLISSVIVIFLYIDKYKIYITYASIMGLFPMIACLNTITPVRFLVPYYSILGCINLALCLKKTHRTRNIMVIFVCIFLLLLKNINNELKAYKTSVIYYEETSSKLQNLAKKYKIEKPIIVNNIDINKFFNAKPFCKLNKRNVLFLNFYYFNSYDTYLSSWKKKCSCNPLSLKEKTDYIISNNNLFIIEKKSMSFLREYIDTKYKTKLEFKNIHDFDDDLVVCNITKL